MKLKEISITVIIPVYNVEKYLIQCLDSVVNQSVLFDEVILVNDGSTDGSGFICEKYVLKYSYFKLICQRNQGLSAARNIGLNHATSEYVMFLDSDDYLRIDTVELLKVELSKFRQDAVYFNADIRCENECIVKRNIYDRNIKGLNGVPVSGWKFFLECYPENYLVSSCMAIYKKRIIENEEILFPEGLYYEDNYFSFSFMVKAQCITYISEKLYQRRYRENSITMSKYSEKKFTDYIKIILLIWNEIEQVKEFVLPEYRKVLIRFISDYCGLALNNYNLCMEQSIILSNNAEVYFYQMIKNYEILLDQYQLEDKVENLDLINRILKNLKIIIRYCQEDRKFTNQITERITIKQKRIYRTILSDLPLNIKQCKVGIYGIGKHTKGLITMYENLIGEIICNLVFLESYKSNKTYMNRKVIHYEQVDKSFDMIIISSFLYGKEMMENVRRIDREIPIYTFYVNLKEDIFSEFISGEG